MNVQAYLDRLKYRGPLDPHAETLRRLHVAHLMQVPFENLSIHANQPIVLNDEALFDKIVTRRRGGFCYELNGLFGALLTELGFKVAKLSAQVGTDAGGFRPDFDHMTLFVQSDGKRWLADVGFGDCFIEPLPFETTSEQLQRGNSYRIRSDAERFVLQSSTNGGDWKAQYRFTLQPYQYSDYEDMCRYHQTSPDSHFTRKRIVSRLTPGGRISLSDMRLIVTEGGVRSERDVLSDHEYSQILRDDFGIAIGVNR